MGYTHYYYYTPKVGDELKMKDVKREILKMKKNLPEFSETAGGNYREHPIKIKNWDGKVLPEITDTIISFNGDGSKGLDHESFVFEPNFNSTEKTFSFCKTARKPYDFFVCVCLLSLSNHLEGIEVSSDGDIEDWQPAIDFYEKEFGQMRKELFGETIKL